MRGKDCRLLNEYLNSQHLMSLATTNGVNLWSAGVCFMSDENLDIYFISGDNTKHVKNIGQNGQVSFTVIDDYKGSLNDRVGVQARGICEEIGDENWPGLLETWNKKFNHGSVTLDEMKKRGSSFYKIVLTKLKYFDTNLTEKVLVFDF